MCVVLLCDDGKAPVLCSHHALKGIRDKQAHIRHSTDATGVATSAEGPPASPAGGASSGEAAARGTCVHIMRFRASAACSSS